MSQVPQKRLNPRPFGVMGLALGTTISDWNHGYVTYCMSTKRELDLIPVWKGHEAIQVCNPETKAVIQGEIH